MEGVTGDGTSRVPQWESNRVQGGRQILHFRPPGPSSEVAPLELGWPSLGLCVAGREAMRLDWELMIKLSEKSEGLLQWLSG